MKLIVLGGLLAAAGAAVATQLPEIRRYLKMRSM
jgi:hypothetical protein